ncbi:16450_t:CDS:10 [Gigaspora margarita]|uniref:16450_t:CDS:1 n=1 Tax=Gigaspora margarita TaxID=4874 RepID=A0ABM8W516_GIGMA|nr:16450_t:CDS:10 [Gigaspora margarita]
MDRTHIIALTKNILCFTSTLATHISIPDVNLCLLCEKEIYSLVSNLSYKEFTLASCGHIFHQKCLEKYLVNREARCPNKDCNRDIETFLFPELFKRSQDKPTTSTAEDIVTKQVDSENPTPVDENANAIYMNELGLLGGEDLLSKMAEIAKETSDQATSPIEVVSTISSNSEKLDNSISKVTSGQIQLPTCKKCSEKISLEFTKPTIFLSCKHVVHYDCIKDSHKMCPTCPLSETMSEIQEGEKTGGKKVSSMIKQLIKELLTNISDGGKSLEETSYLTDTGGVFWKLSNRIDSAKSKNEDAFRDLITSYFDFGEALYNRYKKLKPTYSKDGARALVKNYITPFSVINEAMEYDPSIQQEELKEIVTRAVNESADTYFENSETFGKIEQNLYTGFSQGESLLAYYCHSGFSLASFEIQMKKNVVFNDAFEGVRSVNNVQVAKLKINFNKQKIAENIGDLKTKLKRSSFDHAFELLERLNSLPIKNLKWNDSLASQVISDESKLVQNLEETSKKSFIKPFNKMQVRIPPNIRNIYTNFVESFYDDDMEGLPRKLSHDNSWKEDEFASDQSEGTYVTNVIVPLIHVTLNKLPIKKYAFLSSAERQSLASADRRERGKQPDIMFLEMCCKKIYKLMYIKCSHLICTNCKKKDDEAKLWREMNDEMCYVYKSCRPVRNKFGILGIQVAADMMHLNILIKDDDDIHRLFHLRSVKIPIPKLEKKFVEVEAENAKLKQIIEENAMRDIRVKELEQKNMELEARLAIVEQAFFVVDGQTQNGKKAIAEVWLSIDNSVSTVDLSNSVVDQQNNADTKSIEGVAKVSDKETDDFVSEELIPKESSMLEESSIYNSHGIEKEKQNEISKVEQGLRHELSVFTKDDDIEKHSSFDIQIPEFPLEMILMGSNKITTQIIADLFNVAIKKHTNTNECQKVVSITKSNAHVTKSSEVSISIPITQVTNSSDAVTSSLHETTPSLPLSHMSNSENKISENNKSLPETDPKKDILIRNESDIDALILFLQQKFKISKKILDKWKADIVFEFRDNTKY